MSTPQSKLASKPDPAQYHPVFVHSRREAIVIFCIWLAGFAWAVPFCFYNGYIANIENFNPEKIHTTFGVPTWLFWGIAVPWIVADVATTWFCFFYMKDDDLGEAHEGEDIAEDLAAHDDASLKREEGRA